MCQWKYNVMTKLRPCVSETYQEEGPIPYKIIWNVIQINDNELIVPVATACKALTRTIRVFTILCVALLPVTVPIAMNINNVYSMQFIVPQRNGMQYSYTVLLAMQGNRRHAQLHVVRNIE